MNTSLELLPHYSASPASVAGVTITHDEYGRFNLNALHLASGLGASKKPSRWLSNISTQELVAEVKQSRDLYFGNLSPVATRRGGSYPGTYADKLLAISYAGWVSARFQLLVNQAFIDHLSPNPVDLPQNLPDALRLAADLAEKGDAFKISDSALRRLSEAEGTYNPTQSAKILQIKPKELFTWLHAKKWTYRAHDGRWTAYQHRIDQNHLRHKVHSIETRKGTKMVTQLLITAAGIALISKRLERARQLEFEAG